MSGGYVITHTGRKFYPAHPRIEDIDIRDIAHSLSNLCRFTGHVKQFYSVAQHSIYVSKLMPPTLMLEGLLHDASEAYLGDIATPIKPYLQNYKELEFGIMWYIAKKFNLCELWESVSKQADAIMLATEIRDLMPVGDYGELATPLGTEIYPLSPNKVEQLFLENFYALRRS